MAADKMTQMGDIRKQLEAGGADMLQHLIKTTVQELMRAEAENICGAPHGVRSVDRMNSFNGTRQRPWDTRAGSMTLDIPKLRQGSYYPDWLLEPRRRAERALHQVISECYVLGVSTRRVDKLVKMLGIDGIDKSQVSRISQELDARVEEFRSRPLDASPYRYVWIDALYIKVREGGRTVSSAVGVATAVNSSGNREIIGLDIFNTEDGASWTAFLRGLVARGMSGVQLVVSDCHLGLKASIAAVLPGASWPRCRTHMARNVLTHVPKHAQDMVATCIRTVFTQPDAAAVKEQFARVIEQLHKTKFPKAALVLEGAQDDLLAFAAFPKQHWRQIWSNNPQERLNREIRRRTDVVGIFPNRESIIRLVGAVLAEQNDEWQVSRCYMKFDAPATLTLDAAGAGGEKETVFG